MTGPVPHRPLTSEGPVVLRSRTAPGWIPLVLAHLDSVLIDHAHCEKKAAANALSLLQSYPELPGLPAQMARLAREESSHLARVLQVLEQRGVPLTRDKGDPYVQKLQSLIRTATQARALDRFLVAAIVEARSCERLALLAESLPDPALARFYRELAQSEDGHQALFFRLAEQIDPVEAPTRLAHLLDEEARILEALPLRAAIH